MAAHVATAGPALPTRTGPARGVLHVINSHGGGTERHVLALIDASRARYRHYVAIAAGDRWQVEDHRDGGIRSFEFRRLPGESWPDFLRGMAATFGIHVVHLHNISGCREGLCAALAESGLPYGYTVHDLGLACPTIILLGVDGLYCGGVTDAAACMRCLAAQPAFAGVDIVAWRSRHRDLLAESAFLIAPSQWAAATLQRYFPERAIEVIPHGAPAASAPMAPDSAPPVRTALALPNDDVPTLAVLGAIGPHKGARRLERMVELVRSRGMRVRFVVIGYLDVQHDPWQSDDALLTVHGPYDSRELGRLLDQYRVGLVVYPSAAPETFSYTLSEAWAAGRPVVVPPIGALAARVEGSGAGWVWTDEEWRDEAAMLARIADLLAPAHAGALADAARCARAMPQPALADMAQRTGCSLRRRLRRSTGAAGRAGVHRGAGARCAGLRARAGACARGVRCGGRHAGARGRRRAGVAAHARGPRTAPGGARRRAQGDQARVDLMAASAYEDWLFRGRTHQAHGRPIDAMLCYRRALRAQGEASDARFHLGEVLWQLGRVPDAIAAWRDAAAVRADHLAPSLALAEALLATADATGAFDAAEAALRIAPEHVRAATVRAIAGLLRGDGADSVPAIARLLEREPQLLATPTIAGPLALALDLRSRRAGPRRVSRLRSRRRRHRSPARRRCSSRSSSKTRRVRGATPAHWPRWLQCAAIGNTTRPATMPCAGSPWH